MVAPQHDWWNPLCGEPFSTVHWDFTPCFETTVVSPAPILLLVLAAFISFPALLRRYSSGERLEKGGRAAFGVKIVSRDEVVGEGAC